MLSKLTKNLTEVGSTARDMLALRYPRFVYGAGVNYAVVPVFCFHGVEPASLEAMLRYVTDNGYATLDADEYVSAFRGLSAPPRKAVVLTFDDGWGSLWSVGFPLLKKYCARIVVFIPPGRIEHGPGRLPTIDDLGRKECHVDEVLNRDQSAYPLLTWEEITEMHASGLVDFQSHSFNHALIARSTKIVDFLHPELTSRVGIMEMPCPPGSSPVGTRALIRLGEPLYETAPRLSDIPRIEVDPAVTEACVRYVEERGGARFFERSGWRGELNWVAGKLIAKSQTRPVETPDEQIAAISAELRTSKSLIEHMLPGKTVRHICYPWHVAGRITVEESRKAGYVSAFWGKVDDRYYNVIPGDPFRIARVGGDFFHRLPGEGRISLLRILLNKIARRARHGSPYLSH